MANDRDHFPADRRNFILRIVGMASYSVPVVRSFVMAAATTTLLPVTAEARDPPATTSGSTAGTTSGFTTTSTFTTTVATTAFTTTLATTAFTTTTLATTPFTTVGTTGFTTSTTGFPNTSPLPTTQGGTG